MGAAVHLELQHIETIRTHDGDAVVRSRGNRQAAPRNLCAPPRLPKGQVRRSLSVSDV
jgi:hypothetical protein